MRSEENALIDALRREVCNLSEQRDVLAAQLAALKADIENYMTTAMAAAVEIQEHWAAHCDSEGGGPANLMRRLEQGFPASYGYTAKSLVEAEAEIAALREQVAAGALDESVDAAIAKGAQQ